MRVPIDAQRAPRDAGHPMHHVRKRPQIAPIPRINWRNWRNLRLVSRISGITHARIFDIHACISGNRPRVLDTHPAIFRNSPLSVEQSRVSSEDATVNLRYARVYAGDSTLSFGMSPGESQRLGVECRTFTAEWLRLTAGWQRFTAECWTFAWRYSGTRA